MAFAYVKQLGVASKSSPSTTTFVLTTTGGASAAGNTILVAVAVRTSSVPVTGVVDSAGNTYTIDAAVTSGNVRTTLCACHQALALPNGGTITVTLSAGQGVVAVTADEFANGIIGASATNPDKTATGTGTGTAIATAATAATTDANELVYGALGVQIDATGTAPTVAPGSGYTRTTESVSPSAITRVGVYPEYKVVAATGTQVADGTLSTSKTWAAVVATYREAAVTASARRPQPQVIA